MTLDRIWVAGPTEAGFTYEIRYAEYGPPGRYEVYPVEPLGYFAPWYGDVGCVDRMNWAKSDGLLLTKRWGFKCNSFPERRLLDPSGRWEASARYFAPGASDSSRMTCKDLVSFEDAIAYVIGCHERSVAEQTREVLARQVEDYLEPDMSAEGAF